MRIAHVVKVFLPKSETFVYTELRAHDDLTQMVVAQWTENRDLYPLDAVWELDRASRAAGGFLGRLPAPFERADPFRWRMVRPLRRFGPTLIHAHFGWAGLQALRAARRTRTPLVVTFYGRDVHSPKQRPGIPSGHYDDLFAYGAAFFCVGPGLRDRLVDAGAARAKVHLVPIGLELGSFRFAPAPPDARTVILHVGRLVEKKGTDVAIRAFAAAKSDLPDAELWIVGDGPERGRLEELSEDLHMGSSVTFHGALPHHRVRELMGRAHLGLVPSRTARDGDQEGTPTVILEMQARGVDVVATSHADIPFIVPDPSRLVPEDDHEALAGEMLRRLHDEPEERLRRLEDARVLVERQHDAVRIGANVRALYEQAAMRRTDRGR